MNKNTATNIERNCRDSFDYAAMCAEYYKAKGKIVDLTDISSWKMSRYIRDIARRISNDTQVSVTSLEDVKYIIHLFSMITPIDWDLDKKYLSDEFPDLYDTMERILYGSRNRYEDS